MQIVDIFAVGDPAAMAGTGQLAFIRSPATNGFHLGPLDIHIYGLMYVVAITLAVIITRRRWRAVGGNPDLVGDVALWAVPAGIIGGRIYFDIATPFDIKPAPAWWGPLAGWGRRRGVLGGTPGRAPGRVLRVA